MTPKLALYLVSSILVIWSLDAVNINSIFKQGRVAQARIFYFILALSLIYLLTNFLWDLSTSIKIL